MGMKHIRKTYCYIHQHILFSYMLCNAILGFRSENNSEDTIFIFTVCKKKGLFLWILGKSLGQRV